MKRRQLFAIFIASLSVCLIVWSCHQSKELLQVNSPSPQSESESISSLNSNQQEQLTEQLADAAEQAENEITQRYQLCSDRSQAYLKLPLQEVDSVFRLCAAELVRRTQVRIVLPPKVPQDIVNRQLYPYIVLPETNANQYLIGLTWFPKEFYQSNIANFYGEKRISPSSTLLTEYQKRIDNLQGNPSWQSAIQESGAVSLARGITGYYIAAVCGANCHAAYDQVIWEEQGIRYEIAIKVGGRKAKAIEIVNAAIENQQSDK